MKNIIIDKENLRQVILNSPKQFTKGVEIAKDYGMRENFESVIISGMGGSSLPGDLLRLYLDSTDSQLNIFQNRNYSLPLQAQKNSLNFFVSYSGNTEETVSALNETIEKNLPSIGFATGGKIKELCDKKNIPCVLLPSGIQPRCATGYFFSAMLKILHNSGLIEIMPDFPQLEEYLEKYAVSSEKRGQEIAQNLTGKIPIIYASEKYRALAMIWKIKINENSKTPAFYNCYPELNHNEMVGFSETKEKFFVINLINNNEHPQNLKRIEITSEILKEKGIDSMEIKSDEGDILQTVFSSLLLGDWVSYYLALNYEKDPTPVKIVEDFKKRLS